MEVFALYGPSGTGKSTSALAIAHKYNISAIIDDGLLIYQGRKIAGVSAKYEKTTMQAVKRAIFFYPDHRAEVKEALAAHPITRLLLLGTSENMIDRIVTALELPPVDKFINIYDIRSTAEIKAAKYDREMLGRHVIPIPRVQVEQDYIQKLIARVEKIFSTKKEQIGETTIVHPQFHTGKIHVQEHVLKKLVEISCAQLPFHVEMLKTAVTISKTTNVDLHIKLEVNHREPLIDKVQLVQQKIYEVFLHHLNLEVDRIQVHLQQITVKH